MGWSSAVSLNLSGVGILTIGLIIIIVGTIIDHMDEEEDYKISP